MAYMAAVAPVPWWPPPPELAPVGFLDASSPAGYPEPQTLPFLLAPPPPPPAGYSILPPPSPIVIQLQPHPSLLAEVDHRRSSSLVQVSPGGPILIGFPSHSDFFYSSRLVIRALSAMTQFLKDEGAVPSPEDEKKREKVIRELKKVMRLYRSGFWLKESVLWLCRTPLPGFLICFFLLLSDSDALGQRGGLWAEYAPGAGDGYRLDIRFLHIRGKWESLSFSEFGTLYSL